MNHKLSGIYYGVISATMTVIGLIIGLSTGTDSKSTILLGIISLIFADTLADAFGIYMANKVNKNDDISPVKQGLYVVLSKGSVGLSFLLIYYLIHNMYICQIVSIIWSYIIIIVSCYHLAETNKEDKIKTISKYTIITTIIVIITALISKCIQFFF